MINMRLKARYILNENCNTMERKKNVWVCVWGRGWGGEVGGGGGGGVWSENVSNVAKIHNRRFPEITGEDNLAVFSYSGRVKSPEWRRQWRTADLRVFDLQAWTYYNLY